MFESVQEKNEFAGMNFRKSDSFSFIDNGRERKEFKGKLTEWLQAHLFYSRFVLFE